MTGSSDDDDGGDDPSMRSMRAVWLSMREEDPPVRGLDALLAAARTKADSMREPWWRRAWLVMLRPPVLAMATVVVLLGGAIVIGNRKDKLDANPALTSEPTVTSKDQADLSAKRHLSETKHESRTADAPLEQPPRPPDANKPRPPVVVAAPPETPPTRGQPRARDPETPGGVVDGRGSATELARETTDDRQLERRELQDSTPKLPPPHQPQKPALVIAGESDGAPSWSTSGTGQQGQDNLSVRRDSNADPKRGVRGPSLDQLSKQSETAAARKDCAAVRATLALMQKLDSKYYKNHVATNAAVKRCVK